MTCCCNKRDFKYSRSCLGEMEHDEAVDACENVAEQWDNVFHLPDRPTFHPSPGHQLQAQTYERKLHLCS